MQVVCNENGKVCKLGRIYILLREMQGSFQGHLW